MSHYPQRPRHCTGNTPPGPLPNPLQPRCLGHQVFPPGHFGLACSAFGAWAILSPSSLCPRPAHGHSHLAHSVRKPRRSSGPWGRGGGGVRTTPTSAQGALVGACLLEVASDPGSKSARPWGVPLPCWIPHPKPYFSLLCGAPRWRWRK